MKKQVTIDEAKYRELLRIEKIHTGFRVKISSRITNLERAWRMNADDSGISAILKMQLDILRELLK